MMRILLQLKELIYRLGLLNKCLYIGKIYNLLGFAVGGYNQSRCLMNTILLCEGGILICINLFKSNAGLIKEVFCHFAVGAGGGCKKHYLIITASAGFGFCYCRGVLSRNKLLTEFNGIINLSVLVFLRFTVIPVLNGTIVASNTAVNLGLFTAMGAGINLACDVTVTLTYRVCGRKGIIRKLIIFGNLANKICGSLPIGELFTEECVEYSTRCIKGLKLVLNVKCGENIIGITNRKM